MTGLERLYNLLSRLTKGLGYVAGIILMVLMGMTILDVAGRYLFDDPVPGVFELTQIMMSILVAFGLAYCGTRKGHVGVDIFFHRFPRPLQRISNLLTGVPSLVLLILIVVQTYQHGLEVESNHTVSGILSIPLYPFIFVTALGMAFYALVILLDLVRGVLEMIHEQ
ncbi:MAG: TRAP transporter small permease subunit [Candidatus Tectomicrobia bacterium]|uniref:TRAP transporter small permease subunit n=1 Tax=Tectimicrobiota bacterium TaxID=2528274 RepID=A0A932LZZ0_UNCTE|nr:TRAP transporter small permease subunit [Candidatus Tectomicrobia bacterium]